MLILHIWKLARKEKGKWRLMVIEVDQNIDEALLEELNFPHITQVSNIAD